MGIILQRIRNHPQQPQQPQQQPIIINSKSIQSEIEQISLRLRPEVTTVQMETLSEMMDIAKFSESSVWVLKFTRYSNKDHKYLLSLVDQCKGIKTLKIIAQAECQLYPQLQGPRFPDLTKLILSGCHLLSVQPLAAMHMPQLSQLFLQNNLLVSVRSLRKVIAKIKVINLFDNPITNLNDDCPHHINFDMELEAFNIEQEGKYYYGDDVTWIMKMPIRVLGRFSLNSRHRVTCNANKRQIYRKRYTGITQTFMYGLC